MIVTQDSFNQNSKWNRFLALWETIFVADGDFAIFLMNKTPVLKFRPNSGSLAKLANIASQTPLFSI